MDLKAPIYCQDCKRANSASATSCIWCGVLITNKGETGKFETTSVEIEYLSGIERLNDPTPVRLVINIDGIEISEVMPGSRTIRIPARDVIEAQVADGSTVIEGERSRPFWWWLVLGPLALAIPGKKGADEKNHDYLLTIKYRDYGEIRHAVFHREDSAGLSLVTGVARIVSSLVKRQNR
jgi:hypothetical protein